MKIYITEQQNSKLFEARKEGFRLDVIASARSFNERVQYCKQMLGKPIGNGSSRIVFQIDDFSCLKLAKNEKGIYQNLEEISLGNEPYVTCVPKILNGSDENNGLWVVSEYVLPAKITDFKKVVGVTFKEVQQFIWCVFMTSKPGYNKFANDTMHFLYEEYEDNDDVIQLFNDIHELCMSYNQDVGDLRRIANWGLCIRDGQPTMVALDSGFSFDVRDKYYKRNFR